VAKAELDGKLRLMCNAWEEARGEGAPRKDGVTDSQNHHSRERPTSPVSVIYAKGHSRPDGAMKVGR
jgi:hypothetical protein